MSLLDPKTSYYIMHKKSWHMGGGDICDKHEKKIGYMKKKILSMRTDFLLYDSDDMHIFTVSKKLLSTYPVYGVETPEGNIIGRTKQPVGESLDFYDADEKHVFKTRGGLSKCEYEISDPEEKKVYATVKDADKWLDVLKVSFNFREHYVIHVKDLDFNRLQLLAYAVIIDDVYHSKQRPVF